MALRELALRKAAEEVDDSLERLIAEHQRERASATEERVIVCVRPGAVAAKLVRRGHRLARRFKGPFWVVYVHKGQPGGGERREMKRLFELAHELGGHGVELSGEAVDEEILKFARQKRATFLVLGQSKRTRANEVLRGSSLISRLMRATEHLDILVVADPSKAEEAT